MPVARSLGTGTVVVLQTVAVIGANGVDAAEQTVFSAEFVKTTFEETDGYDVLEEAVITTAAEQVEGDGQQAVLVEPTDLAESNAELHG